MDRETLLSVTPETAYMYMGYFDNEGNWVSTTGYYDENNLWVGINGAYDDTGEWIPFNGHYDETGVWISENQTPEEYTDELETPSKVDKKKKNSNQGGSGINKFMIAIIVILVIVIAVGGYKLNQQILETQAKINEVTDNINKTKQKTLASVVEFDKNGNRIVGYSDDLTPIVQDEAGNEKFGVVEKNEEGKPFVVVRTYNEKGEQLSEERVLKISSGLIKTKEELAEEKKKQDEKKKQEQEEKAKAEREKYSESFRAEGSIKKLPKEYYTIPKTSLRINEVEWRALGLKPKDGTQDVFTYYNYQGNMLPFKEDLYLNRDIYGVAMTLKFFEALKLSAELTATDGQKNMSITLSPDMGAIKNEFKSATDTLFSWNVYPGLTDTTKDNLSSSAEERLKERIPTLESAMAMVNFDYHNKDTNPEYETIYNDMIAEIKKSRDEKMTSGKLAVYAQRTVAARIKELMKESKKITCDEINKFKGGACVSPDTVSSLDIKPDFIEQVYLQGFSEGMEKFIQLLSNAYYMYSSNLI